MTVSVRERVVRTCVESSKAEGGPGVAARTSAYIGVEGSPGIVNKKETSVRSGGLVS